MKKTALLIAMFAASFMLLTACGKKKAEEPAAPEIAAEETVAEETAVPAVEEAAAETEAVTEEAVTEETASEEEVAAEAAEEVPEEEAAEEELPAEDEIFGNDLFSITMPAYFSGRYEVESDSDGIMVYDKASKEADCGGFAFGIRAYEDPADRAYIPNGKKVGELTGADGAIYDIELEHPSDVQWDFNIGPDDYMELYEAGEDIVRNMTGADGCTFAYGAGTKGEDLYSEVLGKYVEAIGDEWDASRLADEDMSLMYYTMALDGRGDVFDRIGYVYSDLNADGVDELMIGEIAEDDRKGIIYDLYSMADRAPMHVFSGTGRDRFFSGPGSLICSEYSDGSDVQGLRVYQIDELDGTLNLNLELKTDSYENEEQPWFVNFDPGNEDAWENITEEDWNTYMGNFSDYSRFDYTPLSSVRDEVEAFAAYDVYRDLLRGADYGEDPAGVITQKNPGADAVGSAIAYAYLLNEIGIDAKAELGGVIPDEVAYALDVFGVEIPEAAENAAEGQFVLIDHSSYEDAIDGMEEARILGLVDRHGIGDVISSGPVNIRVAPVGATATLVYKAYEECGIKIPRSMARVMLMGIVSETGNLTEYYTALDKQAYKELKKIAAIKDFDGFCELMTSIEEPVEEEEAPAEEIEAETEEAEAEEIEAETGEAAEAEAEEIEEAGEAEAEAIEEAGEAETEAIEEADEAEKIEEADAAEAEVIEEADEAEKIEEADAAEVAKAEEEIEEADDAPEEADAAATEEDLPEEEEEAEGAGDSEAAPEEAEDASAGQ